jgi:hypothetical protein
MAKKQVISEKNFYKLNELLRKASESMGYEEDDGKKLEFLRSKELQHLLYGMYPECYLTFKGRGREVPFFPICNRMGMHDPFMMKFSLKLAQKMNQSGKFNGAELEEVMTKIGDMYAIHSKGTDEQARIEDREKSEFQQKIMDKIKNYLYDLEK